MHTVSAVYGQHGLSLGEEVLGLRLPDNEAPAVRIDAIPAQDQLERLGRQRPEKLESVAVEIGFCFSIVMSQIITEYFVSGFNLILPTLVDELDIPHSAATWPAVAFSIVVAGFLLVFGRLGDMYGGYVIFLFGHIWLLVWSVVAGFSQSEVMLDVCRALQGVGPAAFMPAALMVLGKMYRPGPRKNLVFSIYGAAAPVGFFVGILFSGLAQTFLNWRWYFWIGAMLVLITAIVGSISIPRDFEEYRNTSTITMDWCGAITIISGQTLFIFAIADSSHAPHGWKTWYILLSFFLGIFFLALAVYVEGWHSVCPLVPWDAFRVPGFKAVVVVLFFVNGGIGMILLYGVIYMETFMGGSTLQVVAWCLPLVVTGVIVSTIGGFLLHILPGTMLMLIAGFAWVVSPLLFALAPPGASYWAFVFPALVCNSIGIDLIFNITSIFITTNLPQRRQGLAGALINSLLHLGISFFLGFADIIATQTARLGAITSINAVFWFQVGCAAFAFFTMLFFVKIGNAKSDLTQDEKEELEQGAIHLATTDTTVVKVLPPR